MHIFRVFSRATYNVLEREIEHKDNGLFGIDISGGVYLCEDSKTKRGQKRKIKNKQLWLYKKILLYSRYYMKKACTAPTPGCKGYWFVCVCRPQNIMIFLGKRCKANCTFSVEKYTWFTVWKPPPLPQPFHVFTYNKQKQKHKRLFTTSNIWQFQMSAQSVSQLSEHCQSNWDVFTLPIIKCDKGNCANMGPLSGWDITQAKPNSQEVISTTMRGSPFIVCVRSTEAKSAVSDGLSLRRPITSSYKSLCDAWSPILSLEEV